MEDEMMQQLFNGGGRGEERKVFNGGAAEGASSSSNNQNLRCPRCDSTNTKFCYYNNYNLTQPRHFCKTCRRYWTKGGALRNVPVGGGRRKNEVSSVSTAFCKSKMGKAKAGSSDAGKSNLGSGFVHDMPFNPILWGSPQDSHILSLFRATQNPNPNPNPNSVLIKGESTLIGSHMASDSTIVPGSLNTPSLSLDPLNQDTLALSNSLWRNHMHQQQNSTQWGEAPNTGIQQLYQRHRSSTSYYANRSPTMFSSESSSATGGELGYWNSELSWPNVPTTNGAFP